MSIRMKRRCTACRWPVAIFGPDQRLKFSNKAYGRLWDLEERWLATASLGR
jgi:hypothetical protein